MTTPKCDPRFDTRLIAQVEFARVAKGEKAQRPMLMRYIDDDGKVDDSKIWVLSVDGYVLCEKQDIANAYLGYMRSQS